MPRNRSRSHSRKTRRTRVSRRVSRRTRSRRSRRGTRRSRRSRRGGRRTRSRRSRRSGRRTRRRSGRKSRSRRYRHSGRRTRRRGGRHSRLSSKGQIETMKLKYDRARAKVEDIYQKIVHNKDPRELIRLKQELRQASIEEKRARDALHNYEKTLAYRGTVGVERAVAAVQTKAGEARASVKQRWESMKSGATAANKRLKCGLAKKLRDQAKVLNTKYDCALFPPEYEAV